MSFSIIQLKDILGDDKVCESIQNLFACPLNDDVELFLRDKAIEFEKMDLSRTYFVFTKYKGVNTLVGYYSLAIKDISLVTGVSCRVRKSISGNRGRKQCAGFLIGQLGKNYKDDIDKANLITGRQLIRLALDSILDAYKVVGGRAIIVECKDIYYLKRFYEELGFEQVDKDHTDGLLR